MEENELQKRLFKFAVEVLKLLRRLTGGNDLKIISYQLGKSATSSGANYEEAQAAVSRADFGFKVSISLKEMRESNYWLRILRELYSDDTEIERLVNESYELKNILGSINKKVIPRSWISPIIYFLLFTSSFLLLTFWLFFKISGHLP